MDLRNPVSETIVEYSHINSTFDYSSFDIEKLLEILMCSSSSYTHKKSALDQLSLLLFDV